MVYLRKIHGSLLTYIKGREDTALTTLEEIQHRGFPSARHIIISCIAPTNPHNFIFGDYIPLDLADTGPYDLQVIEQIKTFLINKEKLVIMIFPQRHPVTDVWQHKDFFYIELPEFYGVYWDFFLHYQPATEYRPWDRYNVTKHYMCLNKRIVEPRFLWFHDLYRKDLISKGHVSFLCEGERQQYPDYTVYNHYYNILIKDYPWLDNLQSEVKCQLPIQTTDKLEISDSHCGSGGWITDSDLFATSFVNVISETYFNLPGNPIFTEKIFKTIYHCRPFFLLGSPGTLTDLRALGFKTFSPWFDETYDYGNNVNDRALQISNQVEKLCQLSLDQIQDMLMDMRPVLEHNYNRLRELSNELDQTVDQIDHWIIKKINSFTK